MASDTPPRPTPLIYQLLDRWATMPSGDPFSFDAVFSAIPRQGITVAGLALKFSHWVSNEEDFGRLISLAKIVAFLDVETMTWRRKNTPTTAEVMLAIPPEGMRLDCCMIDFSWPGLPQTTRRRIAFALDHIFELDEETMVIGLKGRLTVQEVIDGIPNEGTKRGDMLNKFKERTRLEDGTGSECRHFANTLRQITEYDSSHGSMMFVREDYRPPQQAHGPFKEHMTVGDEVGIPIESKGSGRRCQNF